MQIIIFVGKKVVLGGSKELDLVSSSLAMAVNVCRYMRP